MTAKEFLKLKRRIDKLLEKAEGEALTEGVDITSPRFELFLTELKRRTLAKRGISLEKYGLMKDELEAGEERKELEARRVELAIPKGISAIKGDKGEAGESIEGEKGAVGERGNTGERGEKGEFIIGPRGESGKDGKDGETIVGPRGKKGDKGDTPDISEEMKYQFREYIGGDTFEKSIHNLMGPSFRKLGMGLQAQIDGKMSGTPVDNETPTGTVNGTNKVFTLANAPSPTSSLQFFVNGQLVDAGGEDYTLSNATITTVTAPPTDSILRAWYRI